MNTYDARAVANLILDEAQRKSRLISNLSLQKLLYFCHGLYLIRYDRPMVTGYFEAWQHGPVHPTVYESFKIAGNQPINFRAKKLNLVTQQKEVIPLLDDADCLQTISQVIDAYGKLSPSRLVELSHAVNAPWYFVVDNSKVRPMLGLRITDNVIRERFKFHKFSVKDQPFSGDRYEEDAPFA
jgi:uncharacterized phage-associated protein